MLFSTSEFCVAGKILLFYRHKWNYIHACAFKPCDICKVKNALVKSASVTICNRVLFSCDGILFAFGEITEWKL